MMWKFRRHNYNELDIYLKDNQDIDKIPKWNYTYKMCMITKMNRSLICKI